MPTQIREESKEYLEILFRKEFNQIESTNNQLKTITDYFKQFTNQGEKAA